MIAPRQDPPFAPSGLKPSPVHNPGLNRSWCVSLPPGRDRIDTMAAMNKSLARNNKSQDRGQSAPAGGWRRRFAVVAPEHFENMMARQPVFGAVKFSSSRLARVNPSHHGSDEQMF